jgi:hypothetical protein
MNSAHRLDAGALLVADELVINSAHLCDQYR